MPQGQANTLDVDAISNIAYAKFCIKEKQKELAAAQTREADLHAVVTKVFTDAIETLESDKESAVADVVGGFRHILAIGLTDLVTHSLEAAKAPGETPAAKAKESGETITEKVKPEEISLPEAPPEVETEKSQTPLPGMQSEQAQSDSEVAVENTDNKD